MTVELITGTPGAGKSTYAVAERLAKEAGRKIKLDDETCLKLGFDVGHTVQRRLVCAGVRGLKLEHERLPHLLTRDATPLKDVAEFNAMVTERNEATGKLEETDEPVHKRLPGDPPVVGVPAIMQNWWLWCLPGDLICIDEAQFVMPRGSLGRKPPFWLQCFEIHRHYGVDFIIITQHPQLIDTTVRALVSLHRHVRSIMGSPLCTVYAWDHASNPERYNLATKELWRRRAAHYRLFHSSVAHVKPPSTGRSVFLVLGLLIVAVAGGAYAFTGRWRDKAPAPAERPGQALQQAGSQVTGSQPKKTRVAGCMSVGEACRCIDQDGHPVLLELALCQRSAAGFEGVVRWEPNRSIVAGAPSQPASGARQSALPFQQQ